MNYEPIKKALHLNLYEIRITDDFISNKPLLDSFLFECQCALFLVDILNPESFKSFKKLINNIDNNQHPYLTKILIQNKIDLESQREVTNFEIKEFLEIDKSFDSMELSIKNDNNIQELLKKINTAINESKNELAINQISEANIKQTMMDVEGILSLILIGDTSVGKTCFLERYTKNQFRVGTISNIGIDKDMKYIQYENNNYKLTVWDTAGQERFRTLPRKYYQNADGVLLLFDVCDEKSFQNVSNWIKDVKDNSKEGSNIVIYLIGNKIDKPERKITKEQGEELAKSLGLKYFEVSCKINMNIQEVMAKIMIECLKKNVPAIKSFQLKSNVSSVHTTRRRGGCC